ncbi:hypothetical protein [Microbacterium invictum]|uniref:Uncharacterized protein n=1 Tax=Microbacterium invictum TaxID=515415 RepID=A0AA40SQV9_9MICO|nr:hypothetical protein [Microbacterium invictum]MBB4140636.1 hypothetical protein [Microbacterium invictum]
MEWTADVSAGDWLREQIDDPWRGTMHDVVPRGFAAYARIFHPGSVQELPGGERMPTFDEWQAMTWEQHEPLMGRITDRPVTWAETAAAFGTEFHATAQWGRLVRTPADANDWQQVAAPDGRWFNAPAEGELGEELVGVVAEILAAHTSTPDDGCVALWEGDGALLGHMGDAPSRAFFQMGDPADATLSHHNQMLGHSLKDPFNNPYRKATWQEGILSREISEGARLELPGRGHVLFRGGVRELAGPDWFLHVPWRDRIAEGHGFDPSAHSPSLLWPDDHAWVLVTEVDYDSTIVGGSGELIRALVADDRVEALPLREGADLSWDGDEVNR